MSAQLIADRIDDPVLHIGPARDLSLFEAVEKAAGRRPTLVQLEDASYAVCTGLRDDLVETLQDYETELRALAVRSMTLLCANPDLVIHRGDALVYCAGALARRYEELGGSVVYAGKPYPPIYRRAMDLAVLARGAPIDTRRVLAIGDAMMTDIAGATDAGFRRAFHHRRNPSRRAPWRGARFFGRFRRARAPFQPMVALADRLNWSLTGIAERCSMNLLFPRLALESRRGAQPVRMAE